MQQHQVETARVQVQQALEARRSLGTICLVNWAHYKTVSVSARIVVGRQEDAEGVRQRVSERLNRTISPLPTDLNATGWSFGLALRASNVFDIALREPGVRWVDRVTLQVKEVPGRVNAVAADAFQPSTWYASSDGTLFRSLNDGDSWEPVVQFAEGSIESLVPHPERPGLLAVATRLADGSGSHVHLSNDCGETWTLPEQSFGFIVEDLAWTSRDDTAVLLLATDRGLYQLVLTPGSSPIQVLVDASNPARPLYAVAASRDVSGRVSVAVATQSQGGVFLSHDSGNAGTYHSIGLQNEDIRILAVQRLGPRTFLWAGEAAPGGDDPGKGCFSWELTGARRSGRRLARVQRQLDRRQRARHRLPGHGRVRRLTSCGGDARRQPDAGRDLAGAERLLRSAIARPRSLPVPGGGQCRRRSGWPVVAGRRGRRRPGVRPRAAAGRDLPKQ